MRRSDFIDMTGWIMAEHGVPDSRLTIIQYIGSGKWLAECSCENHNKCEVYGSSARYGYTKSCGCLHREDGRKRGKDSKKENMFDLSGKYGVGWTTNTNEEFYFDLEDYGKIKDYSWRAHTNQDGYKSLRTRIPERPKDGVKMSEVIMGEKRLEHINRNPLDNRKQNLRKATAKENNRNRGRRSDNKSGVIGVWWNKKQNKWQSYIRVDGELKQLGLFVDKTKAIVARLMAEKEYFKEFAPQQELYKEYGIN